MSQQLISTKDITGRKVWIEKPKKKDPDATKKMGKVRACVFHPKDKRCVGFIVKRPDLALMFHRKDLFVAYNGYDEVGGTIVVRDDPAATDKGACKALGVNWDECVLWVGLPVMCQDGTEFGLVGAISYDAKTGAIDSLEVTQGATTNALLGVRRVPVGLVRGFRRGMGAELVMSGDEGEDVVRGAILVDDEVKNLPVEGGFAEKAGEATAVVGDKAHRAMESAKPKVDEAKAVAGEAATKGAYATGRQIKRASHMFSDFKEEFDKASGKKPADAPVRAVEAARDPSSASVAAAASVGAAADAAGASADAGAAGAEGVPNDTVTLSSLSCSSSAITSDAEDEDVEYVFVDEDGCEVVFVDEDGNVITDPDAIGEDFDCEDDVVIEAGKPESGASGASSASRASAVRTSAASGAPTARTSHASGGTEGAAAAVGSHLKKAGGMFSAFKEEFDKASRE